MSKKTAGHFGTGRHWMSLISLSFPVMRSLSDLSPHFRHSLPRLGVGPSRPRRIRKADDVRRRHRRLWFMIARVRSHSEISANHLIELKSNFRDFSECPLISIRKKPDFDSAVLRFDSGALPLIRKVPFLYQSRDKPVGSSRSKSNGFGTQASIGRVRGECYRKRH
jgi:hypothetical protein